IGNYTLTLGAASLSAMGYQSSCPPSGSTNISIVANNPTLVDFGLTCITTFDLNVWSLDFGGTLTPTTVSQIKPYISNQSCIPASGIIHVILDPKVFFVSNSNNSITYTFSGDTISWPFTGLTNTNSHLANWQNAIRIQGIPTLLPTDTICFEAFVTPTAGDNNPVNNFRTLCVPAFTSYDPNAKYVSPEGIGATGIIPADTALTYTVKFQNTGTFAARDIYILDTLDADLDLATLVILGSSHPMDVQILPGNVLRFNFPLIWLPDSNSNEPASHGWLQYFIDQKPNLAPGTVIENTAAIYFDFNAPVITNTTINTLENPAAIEQLVSENGVAVFPNPASDEINLIFDKSFTGTIMLTDALGRVVLTQRINASTTAKLMLENLPAGVYSLVIQDGEKQVVKKIVVAH
ncbi:MAG: T9SS type A sorting domain-containing protein, partial [Bacteroidia bacterium]